MLPEGDLKLPPFKGRESNAFEDQTVELGKGGWQPKGLPDNITPHKFNTQDGNHKTHVILPAALQIKNYKLQIPNNLPRSLSLSKWRGWQS